MNSFSRTLTRAVCLSALLTTHVACAQTTTPLPLVNGGFEAGAAGWTFREKVPMSSITTDAARSGKHGLRVEDQDGAAGSSALSDKVAVSGGQNLRLGFWAKTQAGQAAVVQFRFFDAAGKAAPGETVKLPVKTTGGTWAELALTDRAPATAATVAVWIHSYPGAKATLLFDDFSLHADIPAGAATVTNSGATNAGAANSAAAAPVQTTADTRPAPAPAADTAPTKVSPATGAVARQSPPYVIIKADDLRHVHGRAHLRWRKFADFIRDRKVQASIGVISNSLEGDNPAYIAWIKEQHATGLFEFWNHGYVHEPTKVGDQSIQEFKGPSYEEQKKAVTRGQQLAKEKLGFAFTTFGAPSNAHDATTARVLSEEPVITTWLYGNEKEPAGKLVLDRVYPVNIENPLFVPSLDKFIEGYNRFPKRDYFVIQGHPAKWDEPRFEQFTKIVDFLIEQKAVFVTPAEFGKVKAAK